MARTIAVGEFRFSVDELGSEGPPVVAVHSSGMTSRQWKRLAERLAPTHRVLLPDLLGHGASTPWAPGRVFHFSLDVLGIEALLDALDAPVHLVGHSYGGLVALVAALHRPRAVRTLSLIEPVAFGVMHTPEHEAEMQAIESMPFGTPSLPATPGAAETWLTWFVDYWNGAGAFANLPERMRAAFLATAEICYGEVASLLTDRTPALVWSTIEAATLLVRGEQSPSQARHVAEILATAMPNATLCDVKGAGHMSPVTHADEVADRVERHIASR